LRNHLTIQLKVLALDSDESQLDPAQLTEWYSRFELRLRAFLKGVLRNATHVDEAVQATFTKALTHGGSVQPGSEKAWLFQVAYHEAMAIHRRSGVDHRGRKHLSTMVSRDSITPDESLLRWEEVQRVRDAIERLSDVQQQVVRMRIYEQKTFQAIADELKTPIGTILTRMRSALQHLQQALNRD